jgi:hypothetical protein
MKRMSHEEYVEKCRGFGRSPMAKADFDGLDDDNYKKALEPDDEDEDEDEDPDEGEDEEKSLTLAPDEEELAKSMDYLISMTESDQGSSRLSELAAKAAAGALEKSERVELQQLLAAQDVQPEVGEEFFKSETAMEAFEATPFLTAFAREITGSVGELAKSLRDGQTGQLEFNRRVARGLDSLAKSLFAERRRSDGLIKSLTEQVERVSGQPVPFKAQVSVRDLEKGRPSAIELEQLQKSQNITARQARGIVSTLFDEAYKAGNTELAKSLEGPLTRLSVCHGDWREGLSPDLVKTITNRSAGAVG